MNAQCGWATFSLRGRHTFSTLLLKVVGAQRSGQRAHIYTDGLVFCQQRRKICRGLHGLVRVISCSSRFICSLCGCSDSLLGFLCQLCFGAKRGKLSDSIIVGRTIKAYEEFGIGVLFCD